MSQVSCRVFLFIPTSTVTECQIWASRLVASVSLVMSPMEVLKGFFINSLKAEERGMPQMCAWVKFALKYWSCDQVTDQQKTLFYSCWVKRSHHCFSSLPCVCCDCCVCLVQTDCAAQSWSQIESPTRSSANVLPTVFFNFCLVRAQ